MGLWYTQMRKRLYQPYKALTNKNGWFLESYQRDV